MSSKLKIKHSCSGLMPARLDTIQILINGVAAVTLTPDSYVPESPSDLFVSLDVAALGVTPTLINAGGVGVRLGYRLDPTPMDVSASLVVEGEAIYSGTADGIPFSGIDVDDGPDRDGIYRMGGSREGLEVDISVSGTWTFTLPGTYTPPSYICVRAFPSASAGSLSGTSQYFYGSAAADSGVGHPQTVSTTPTTGYSPYADDSYEKFVGIPHSGQRTYTYIPPGESASCGLTRLWAPLSVFGFAEASYALYPCAWPAPTDPSGYTTVIVHELKMEVCCAPSSSSSSSSI